MAYFRSMVAQLFATSYAVYCVSVEFRVYDEETYGQYYTYGEFSRRLEHFAEKYWHICRLGSVAKSAEGRDLWVMRITNLLTGGLGKPRFIYVGNMDRDEVLSRQMLIYLSDYLLSQYGSNRRVTELIDTTDVYIVPSGNPDGFEKPVEGDCNGSHENHQHFDLNPNLHNQVDEQPPEMFALFQWLSQKKFVLAGNLQAGSAYFTSHDGHMYEDDDKDDALFHYLVQTFTENRTPVTEADLHCPVELGDQFRTAEGTDVQGSKQDFSYFRGNCLEVTFQLSCCKYPLASVLYTEWNNSREALLAYMEKVHIGVRGYVMTTSGMRIPDANISVAGLDHVITTWIYGDYYRLLLPGTYNVTASSPGYRPSTVNDVTVTEGKFTLLNFTLKDWSEKVSVPGLPITPVTYQSTVQVPDNQQASRPDISHHSYSDMEVYLQRISSLYPSLTQLYSVGQSVLGRELYVVKISSNVATDDTGKPEIMFVGNLRGNDAVGREILLNLVEYLCGHYSSEPLITQLVNRTTVHILPSMNPDGHETPGQEYVHADGEFGHDGETGQNSDLSRNFPDRPHADDHVRPETKAVMNWIKAHSFVFSARIVGGAIGVTYPGSVDSVDEAVFKSVARDYLESLQTSETCEEPHEDNNIMNHDASKGIDLDTWAYRNSDTLGVSIGISCDLNPPVEYFRAYWTQNQRPLVHFINQVHFSVRGRVTDNPTGQPVANATLKVDGSRHVVHTSNTGEYRRPLAPGMYQLHAFIPGYVPLSAPVTVTAAWVGHVDFALTRQERTQSESQVEEGEFRRLVENLSSSRGLEQLVQSYLPARTLRYRKHTERSDFLRGLHLGFPHIARLYSLGNSCELRPIWALEISAVPESTQSTVPKIRYVAGVHGNAAAGPELLLEFASVLCINYGGDPAITKLIDRSRILIVPCLNPDGRERAQEGTCFSTAGLANAHGVDLDTDFIYGNTSAQPETRAMMNLIERGRFSLSVTLEGGSLLTTYPYDRPTEPAHNEETLSYLASVYASRHPVMHLGYPGCVRGLDSVQGGVLRGSEFRGHVGSMKDFSMDVGLCPEITVYTGCCLFPPSQQLFPLWAEHRTALFAMLLEIHKGLSGVVKDEAGRPVSDAVIKVNGSVSIHTDAQGFFHTLLAPGTQQLQVQASGFLDQFMQVNVPSQQKTVPVMIRFSENSRRRSQGLVLAAAISIPVILLCLLLMWRIRSAKFSRLRDSVRWLRRLHDDRQTEAVASEKLPLQGIFLEDSESEDDAYYLEHH